MRPLPLVFGCALVALVTGCGKKAEPNPAPAKPAATEARATGAAEDWRDSAKQARDRGAAYLAGQSPEGQWRFMPGKDPDLGISALAAYSLLRNPSESTRPIARKTLDWLAGFQKPDGGIYDKELAVYITAAAVLGFKESGEPSYAPVLAKAGEYIRLAQLDGGEGTLESSENFGGIGYGGSGTVNMSTTQWALEAASAAGIKKDDEFYKRALVFLQRSQNRSESNDRTPREIKGEGVVAVGNDGGGIYAPSESKAGTMALPDGSRIFRSYGSMTYALLKSYLLCDLDAKDARVKAAWDWIRGNWNLGHNPGMESDANPTRKYEGLFYYYLTLARTLSALEKQGIQVAGTPAEFWRRDLAVALTARQAGDGSWTNQADRWFEGSPALVTAYALLTLAECLGNPQ